MPYVYYVYDHDTDKTVYITEELDDAREWIDEHIGLGDYEINKYIDYGVYLFVCCIKLKYGDLRQGMCKGYSFTTLCLKTPQRGCECPQKGGYDERRAFRLFLL